MTDPKGFAEPDPLAERLDPFWLAEDRAVLNTLADDARPAPGQSSRIHTLAQELAEALRAAQARNPGLESLLSEYAISSEEGVVMMCLAEALLRIPDDHTAIHFLEDQIQSGDWQQHLSHSPSFWVNASTWGLLVCGRFLNLEQQTASGLLQGLLQRLGEPVMLSACRQAVEFIGASFVAGRSIEEALRRLGNAADCTYSFDMLGEAAMTGAAARRYHDAYAQAIGSLASKRTGRASISVKLSALHPRYQYAQRERCIPEISTRLLDLCKLARDAGIGLTIDAEEAARLQISLQVFEAVYAERCLKGWDGFGLAVQAYQKRAPVVIDWLGELADRHGRRIPLRLVKGAYWDTEIKVAQQEGLPGYPVYQDKVATDISWLACARRLLKNNSRFYAQFATHNAHSIASVLIAAEGRSRGDFELQRLHGMGEALHMELHTRDPQLTLCTYAPVGPYRELLPYLVRRLLENGANSSFLHQLAEPDRELLPLLREPTEKLDSSGTARRLCAPTEICLPERQLAPGINLDSSTQLQALLRGMEQHRTEPWQARAAHSAEQDQMLHVRSPADQGRVLGQTRLAGEHACRQAWKAARDAQPDWEKLGVGERSRFLESLAEALWEDRGALAARITREGGRTLKCAVGEIRETMDFCYYYAHQARQCYDSAQLLPGPTGEANYYRLRARGVFACISPWNFPLAIFSGQILAALATGNSVLAKPASQTTLTAARAMQLMHDVGIPPNVLQFLPCSGATFERAILGEPELGGVAFTGSNATAARIRQVLYAADRPAIPFIAETGGINCMIVDSTALPEQVVGDALTSAFDSAGQRCSALRILCIQEEIAESVCEMLAGAIPELQVGLPWHLASDQGPVIDRASKESLLRHREWLQEHGRLLAEAKLPDEHHCGHFVTPQAWRIDDVGALQQEVFGPFLHVVTWQAGELDTLIDEINHLGYGLTLGIASRIRARWYHISQRARVGNIYINRNMIGAHPGIQPFGGQGLSGTGPKAGGPGYLQRFGVEQSISVNTAAIGGIPALLGSD